MSTGSPDNMHLANPDSHVNIFNFKECEKTYTGNENRTSPLLIGDVRISCSCEECGQQFRQVWHLQKHRAVCSRQKPEYCTDSFLQSGLLNSASLKTTESKGFPCQVCNKTLKSNETLKQHVLTHGTRNSYKCDKCSMRFKTSQRLYIHRKRYHTEMYPRQPKKSNMKTPTTQHATTETNDERSFTCGECGKVFASKRKRSIHTRTHTRDYSFKCSECGNAFATKSNLDIHTFTHTGNYPFTCDYPKCNYKCATKVNLNSHKCSKHTGEKPFACDQPNCTHKYTTHYRLTYHKQTKHTDNLTGCGKTYNKQTNSNVQTIKRTPKYRFKYDQPRHNYTFHSRTQLKNDKRSKHTGDLPYFCNDCGKWFASPCTIKHDTLKHFGIYPYSCEICDRKFLYKTKFMLHQQRHAENRPYKNINGKSKNATNLQIKCQNARKSKKYPHYCQICNKKFKSKRGMSCHSLIHRKVQPFKCTICHKSYESQADLKNHTLVNHDDVPENCTYQRKVVRVAQPAKSFPERAIDSVSDESSQVGFKPFDDSARCKAINRHVGPEHREKPKSYTSTLSYIDVPTHLHDANNTSRLVNQSNPENFQPITEPNDLANIHLQRAPENLSPSAAEKIAALIKQTKTTHQQSNNSALQTNESEKFKSQVNPLPDSGNSPTGLIKQTDDQTTLTVADLIHLHDMNLQTLTPFCHSAESSTGIVKLTERPKFQLLKSDSWVSDNFSDSERGTTLEEEMDQRNIQSLSDPNDLENINTQVTQANPSPVINTCKTSSVKQTKDETKHSVAELIRLYDMNLGTRSTPPFPRIESNPGSKKSQTELQTSQTDFGDTCLLTSQTNFRISNEESITNLKECGDQQKLHSKLEESDLKRIDLETSRKHPSQTNAENNSRFERQIHDRDLQSVVEVTHSDSDSYLPDTTKKTISRFKEDTHNQNVQSVVEVIDLDNDDLQTSLKYSEPTYAEHLQYDNVLPTINSKQSHLNTHNRNSARNNAETRSHLMKQVSKEKLQPIIPLSDFSKVSLNLSQKKLLKSNLLTQPHCQKTNFVLKQMKVGNTGLQPETAAVESSSSLVKNSNLRKMRTRKGEDYFSVLQTSDVKLKKIVRTTNSMKSAFQINKTPQAVEKLVHCTSDVQTTAAKHVFMPDMDARLEQQASLKIARIILERIDATALFSRTTTKNIKANADTSAELTEQLFSNQPQKPHNPKFHTKPAMNQPSDKKKLRFRHKKGAMQSKEKTPFCGECGRSFINRRSLYVHNFKHNGKYPFGCDQPNCSFKCHARPILENHKRSKHTGERPYICKKCGKSFTTTHGLNKHSLRHNKARAYE